jgi:adenosylcobyric acid synthase
VLAYPRVSNFDDFDPLRLEPDVDVLFVRPGTPVPGNIDLVILPGSKATIADLAVVKATGWDIDIAAHLRRGGAVLGICGGYQMLGRRVSDPAGIEGPPGDVEGLGLLDVGTELTGSKLLAVVGGTLVDGAVPFTGYEMHIGRTTGPDCATPVLAYADGRSDGAISRDGRVQGCYVHGLFGDDRQRAHWLKRLGGSAGGLAYDHDVDATLDALATHLGSHVDSPKLLSLARVPTFMATS